MQSPNSENSIPAMELNTLCQTKQEEDAKGRSVQEGELIFPTFSISDAENKRYEFVRHIYETVPITYIGRGYRGNATHFPMGVYDNEVPTKSHCHSSYGRMRPYFIPHRTRTKSESSDPTNLSISRDHPAGHGGASSSSASASGATVSTTLMETCEHAGAIVDTPMNAAANSGTRYKNPVVVLRKSSSLENVRVDNSLEGSQHSHEMEFVSSRIQKLKVQEEM